MSEKPSPAEDRSDRKRRTAWFARYTAARALEPPDLPLRCPCCLCTTLGERGGYEICPVCWWEDDGQDEHDADVVRGGPNGEFSLTAARENYRRTGVCDARSLGHVRPPRADELPPG